MFLNHLCKSNILRNSSQIINVSITNYSRSLIQVRLTQLDRQPTLAFKQINQISALYNQSSKQFVHFSCVRSTNGTGNEQQSSRQDAQRQKHEQYKFFYKKSVRKDNQDILMYGMALVLFALAASYAAVPIYRIYCQSSGLGGKPMHNTVSEDKIKDLKIVKDRQITVQFNADAASQLRWNFQPTQKEIKLHPGETALAFYTVKNPLDVPVNGIATYSVVPFEAGQYLNKIQCFCFEEQQLDAHEEVDMPVLFYFDADYAEDPRLENVHKVVLSYTFFEAKERASIPFFSSEGSKESK